jgi:iron complex transport system permease protein
VSRLVLPGLALVVAALFAASLLIGPAGVAPLPSLRALLTGDNPALALVMREIRLPRAVLGALIGAALGSRGRRCRATCATRSPSRG